MITNMLTKHCKLCNSCRYRMDHHCLYLMTCIAVGNHSLFCWLLIFAFINMVAYCVGSIIYTTALYGQTAFTWMEIFMDIFHSQAWPHSLTMLNAASAFWAFGMLANQFSIVVNNTTDYFTHSTGQQPGFRLTRKQQLINFVDFLFSRPLTYHNPNSPFAEENIV